MKTLVLYTSTDPVQVFGAAILRKAFGTDTYLVNAASSDITGFEKVVNLRSTISTEVQATLAITNLGFEAGTYVTGPTTYTGTTIGKTGSGWTVNAYANDWVLVKTGSDLDLAKIVSNTATVLTVATTFANTPGETSEFQIIDAEDIDLTWSTSNAVSVAWGILGATNKTLPVALLAGDQYVLNGTCNVSSATISISGLTAHAYQNGYAVVKDVTDSFVCTRKITDNATTSITAASALPTIANGSNVRVAMDYKMLLLDDFLKEYAKVYLTDPNNPFWTKMIDSQGSIAKGGPATYNEVLFAEALTKGEAIFDALNIERGSTVAQIVYRGSI